MKLSFSLAILCLNASALAFPAFLKRDISGTNFPPSTDSPPSSIGHVSSQVFAPNTMKDFGNVDVISSLKIIDYTSKSDFSCKGDVFAITVQFENTVPIPADSNAKFAIPTPFYGFQTSFPITDYSGNVVAQVNGDPSTNIFDIRFNDAWTAKNCNFDGSFTFYSFLAYNGEDTSKRDGQVIALSEPTNVILIQVYGPDSKVIAILHFNDVTKVTVTELPNPISKVEINDENSISASSESISASPKFNSAADSSDSSASFDSSSASSESNSAANSSASSASSASSQFSIAADSSATSDSSSASASSASFKSSSASSESISAADSSDSDSSASFGSSSASSESNSAANSSASSVSSASSGSSSAADSSASFKSSSAPSEFNFAANSSASAESSSAANSSASSVSSASSQSSIAADSSATSESSSASASSASFKSSSASSESISAADSSDSDSSASFGSSSASSESNSAANSSASSASSASSQSSIAADSSATSESRSASSGSSSAANSSASAESNSAANSSTSSASSESSSASSASSKSSSAPSESNSAAASSASTESNSAADSSDSASASSKSDSASSKSSSASASSKYSSTSEFSSASASSKSSSESSESSSTASSSSSSTKNSMAHIIGAYYASWSVYGANHFPLDLPLQLTHVFYAFMVPNAESGNLRLTDEWADVQKPIGLSNGAIAALMKLKASRPMLKVIVAIGGWGQNEAFRAVMGDMLKRNNFVNSAIDVVKRHGFDGIDIDWEYPSNAAEGAQLLELLRQLRRALDDVNPNLTLSVAAPANGNKVSVLNVPAMDQILSFWNVMCYDFAGGSWSDKIGYHSNLYGFNGANDFNADLVLRMYILLGASLSKLVMGMPTFGAVFLKPKVPQIGSAFDQTGNAHGNTMEYNKIPKEAEKFDSERVAAFAYDLLRDLIITYDNVATVRIKADYVKQHGLAGGFWWDSKGDAPSFELIKAFEKNLH